MNAPNSYPIEEPVSISQALALRAGLANSDPRKFERRLGVILWLGLFTVLFTIG